MGHRRRHPSSRRTELVLFPDSATGSHLTDTAIDNPKPRTAEPPAASSAAVVPAASPPAATDSLSRRLTTATSTSWCLSLAIHLTAYSVAGAIFAWMGFDLIPEPMSPPVTSIQASLGDETVLDDLPALQIVPTAGPDSTESARTLQQLASQIEVADEGQLETVVADAKTAIAGSSDSAAGDAGDSPFFRIPESGLAVTKGSFTAWTDPPRPLPEQFYQIIIEVRLPDDITRYRLSDLSGEVVGTDGYHQRLPYDVRKPSAARVTGGAEYETVRRNMTVKVTERKLQLAIRVPGARRLVMDRIRIKSRRLREDRELTLVFGRGDQQPGLNEPEE